jgi:hypothetical protein
MEKSMNNEIIDNAVSEMAEQAPIQEEETLVDAGEQEAAETEALKEEKEAANDAEDGDEVKDEPFPKKAVNAIAKRDKQLAKWRAKYDNLHNEVAELRKLIEGNKAQDALNPDNYDTILDYMLAKAEQNTQEKINETLNKQNKSQDDGYDAFVEQRTQEIAPIAQKLMKQIPDFAETLDDAADEIDELPRNVQTLLLHADNPPLAAYNLIKEGKLEKLGRMPESLAAAEIIRAQANNPVEIKKVSQAPTPVKPISGTARGNQSLDNMGVEDVLSKYIRK